MHCAPLHKSDHIQKTLDFNLQRLLYYLFSFTQEPDAFDFSFTRRDIQGALMGIGDKSRGRSTWLLIYRRSVASIGTCAPERP